MIRDIHLRILFIPLLGVCIPVISGIITYDKYSVGQLILANTFFILTSWLIWTGCNWIHMKLRPVFKSGHSALNKVISVSILSVIYGAALGSLCTIIWFRISKETFMWDKLIPFNMVSAISVIVVTLIYEILFLRKERELDVIVAEELEKERLYARLSVLYNELDTYFIFNSLKTLGQLILTNPEKAYSFNTRLSEVYKYVLSNRRRDLVPLNSEMDFFENYFSLLQFRYHNKLLFETGLFGLDSRGIMLPPCSLKTLLENAVGSNEFTDADPLLFKVYLNGEFLKVSNNKAMQKSFAGSYGSDLRNLNSRYRLICNKDIIIEDDKNDFLVKLPLVYNHQNGSHVKHYYY